MRLFIIKKVLVQEKEMSEDRKVSDRIVIIRPIVRGKEIKSKVKNILTIASRFTPSGRAYKKGVVSKCWLKFYVHPSTLADNGNETMEYFSNTGANLLSLEQFLYRLMNDPDNVFNATIKLCKVTVYANEYFYEQNPMQANAPKNKNLWKTFANAPDRTFDLLVNTSHEISPDGQSRYHQAVVSIRQMSIKTVFTEGPEGMRVWGWKT